MRSISCPISPWNPCLAIERINWQGQFRSIGVFCARSYYEGGPLLASVVDWALFSPWSRKAFYWLLPHSSPAKLDFHLYQPRHLYPLILLACDWSPPFLFFFGKSGKWTWSQFHSENIWELDFLFLRRMIEGGFSIRLTRPMTNLTY